MLAKSQNSLGYSVKNLTPKNDSSCMQIFVVYFHYLFSIYSQYFHYMFTISSLYVHYMFTICSLYVHYMFTIRSLYAVEISRCLRLKV